MTTEDERGREREGKHQGGKERREGEREKRERLHDQRNMKKGRRKLHGNLRGEKGKYREMEKGRKERNNRNRRKGKGGHENTKMQRKLRTWIKNREGGRENEGDRKGVKRSSLKTESFLDSQITTGRVKKEGSGRRGKEQGRV